MRWGERLLGALVAITAAAGVGCADVNDGLVGRVAECRSTIAAYESAERPAVSALTLVDTRAGVEAPALAADRCCLDGWWTSRVDAFELLGGSLYPSLPPDAARYPWGGYCWNGGTTESDCDVCNRCPYGLAELQGVWGDAPPGLPPAIAPDQYGDIAQRVEVDGNTLRWRAKNRRTGFAAEYRGYYFCGDGTKDQATPDAWGIGVVWLAVERTVGSACPLRYDARGSGAADEPLPNAAVNEAMELGIEGVWQGGSRDVVGLLAIWHEHFSNDNYIAYDYERGRRLCHPGEAIAYVGEHPEDYAATCPDESEFFDCWDATGE